MKLKYKKIILLTTMSTMGIGLLTLSLSHDKTNAQDNSGADVSTKAVMSDETVVDSEGSDMESTTAYKTLAATDLTPTQPPTPTPLPVYDIEKDAYPKIDQLIQDYYAAKNNRDVNALKELLSDPTKSETQEELQNKTEYIEDYRKIRAYTKKGFKEGTYIVYAYYEIKFTSINTPAPSLTKFYVITDKNNELKIFSGVKDEETQNYYDDRNSDEDVISLIEMTTKKGDKAIEKDEDLLNFWKKMEEIAGNSSSTDTKTKGEGDSN